MMSWTIFIIALNNVYSSNKKKKIENKKEFDFILNWNKRFNIRRVGLNCGGCLHTSGNICGHKTESMNVLLASTGKMPGMLQRFG